MRSGKSSLILALLRLVSPNAGSIFIDGVDISTIRPAILRRRLNAVPQDSFTMAGTIRSNVDPFGENSDADIISVAKELQIWTALERRGGLDVTLLNQPLSQGEQQLLCLARAMLRKSKVLILDEATSSLDDETDRAVRKVVEEKFASCTVIYVAHRVGYIPSLLIPVFMICERKKAHQSYSLARSCLQTKLLCWKRVIWSSLIVQRTFSQQTVFFRSFVNRSK